MGAAGLFLFVDGEVFGFFPGDDAGAFGEVVVGLLKAVPAVPGSRFQVPGSDRGNSLASSGLRKIRGAVGAYGAIFDPKKRP